MKLRTYIENNFEYVGKNFSKKVREVYYDKKNKKAIYDLTIDKRVQKIGDGNKLEKYDMNKLPTYINNNLEKLKDWID